MRLDLSGASAAIARVPALGEAGRVLRVVGGVVEATGPRVPIGELCVIDAPAPISSEVIGFREHATLLMPLGESRGIQPGALVSGRHRPLSVRVGESALGRVLDGLGQPIDALGPVRGTLHPISAAAPAPLDRRRILTPLVTGVRAIDGLLTCGQGQRLGIFAGSGVGKSVLLGMIARHARADVNVIALVGERGREVRDFLERDLGDGLARSVVVVATADQPPLVRIKAAMVALTFAEYFREQGREVLFMMDSLTRVVMAQREIGLAAGEPPTTKGYPPSAFALLPQLLERVGAARRGSITGLFAVLVEADDLSEPVSDAARAILDGHIALSRRLAQLNHYPAIDVLASVSRVMPQVVSAPQRVAADEIRRVLAVHAGVEEVLNLGAYVAGSNPDVDDAVERLPAIHAFLRQPPETGNGLEETVAALQQLAVGRRTASAKPDVLPPAIDRGRAAWRTS
jgi:flagellum-specific ATP synthase